MADFIVIMVLLVLVVSAVCYLVRARKKGQACIGCPNASKCGRSSESCCAGRVERKESDEYQHMR